MLMDKVTEIIAHMFGIFHTTLEEERMREVYDKFKSLAAADPENEALEATGVTFKAKYKLEGFNANLKREGETPTEPPSNINIPFFSGADVTISNLAPIVAAPAETVSQYASVSGFGKAILMIEPPSSVVVITIQYAFLDDNDLLLLGTGDTVFTDPAEFLAQLQQYQTIATAIAAPLSAEMVAPGEDATQDAIALHHQISTAEATTLTGVVATMLHGVDAIGLHINGEVTEEIPALDDLWPAFRADDAGDADDDPDTDDDPGTEVTNDHEWPDPFEGLAPGYSDTDLDDIEDGHAIVTGANLLVNEVIINSAWLDAPVISVMGDVVNLSVISQINVLVDQDYGTFNAFAPSTAMNAATLSATATTPVPDEGESNTDPVLPSNWAVTRIEGDLIAINQISQYSFVTDDDRAEVRFDSTNVYISTGDNTVINLTDLSELGFGYDLIMIGGSMISVNWINQINVMIDNDTVTYSGDLPADFSGGDNLLFNGATMNSEGIDSYGGMQDNFAAASADFANGALTIDEDVAHDSVFEGTEILRVLYIEGDLTTVNWIEQTNVLGDSDQVHLALDNLETATGATATVTTGSNATVNIATINEYGVDSTVAVNGEVYDDALLYQAELIDTDADPFGVDMPALATEAVAFLADDMMTPDTGPADPTITATAPESTASPDVMQSMLA